jgi:hypothetical protein
MKEVKLRTRSLYLPESWEEISRPQLEFTMKQLMLMKAGAISPQQARVRIFIDFTRFTAKPHIFTGRIRLHIWFLLRFLCVLLYGLVWKFFHRVKAAAFSKYLLTWYQLNRPIFEDNSKELISLNLIRLSEVIDFPFKINSDGSVSFNYTMRKNPLPSIKINRKIVIGKFFNVGPLVTTNITAQEFCDAFDAYRSIGSNPEVDKSCINLICAILYPHFSDHNRNINSAYPDAMNQLFAGHKFVILFWFQSICEFLFHHPVYSILFQNTGIGDASDRISIGMDEIIMNLSLAGFDSMSGIEHRSVIDFFDMQIEHLRFRIREAISNGASQNEIADAMHLTLTQINQLS